MSARPTTAGVIATFNQSGYIAEAALTLAPQVDELIVVDDASTDDTADVLTSLALSNLRVIRNERQLGVSRTFTKGIATSTADLILIQGGDDRALPNRSLWQIDALTDPGVSLSFSLPIVIDEHGERLPDWVGEEFQAGRDDFDPLPFLYYRANYICAPSAAFRRVDYLETGGFRGGLDLLQDYDLWLMLAARGRFAMVDEPVVEYRKHGVNLSREHVGAGTPKQRRFAAEQEFIRNDFLTRIDESALARLADSIGLDMVVFGSLTRPEKVALIQLLHTDRLVVRRGLDFLFGIAAAPDADERFQRLGLEYRDLERFTIIADHENLEDVGRALGAVSAVARAARKQNEEHAE